MKTVIFINNTGGVGKTTLVYHLAWMFQELRVGTVAVDLDPQANLTAAFLSDLVLERLWLDSKKPNTILGVIQPVLERLGDLEDPVLESLGDYLALLPGHLGLSRFEELFADSWSGHLQRRRGNDALSIMTAFHHVAERSARLRNADLVLLDVGPSLSALNRAALVAADHMVIPLSADLYSLQGLHNLGEALRDWREGWSKQKHASPHLLLPCGAMESAGYVILQLAIRADQPAKAYQGWIDRIATVYHHEILEASEESPLSSTDPHLLARLKHYRSLMPLAQDARKPMFLLKPADGAIGGHSEAVQDCYRDFKTLALKIADVCGITVPD